MALRQENFLLRRYVEKAMVDLPALPTVVMQVVQATEKDTASTAEIEELLQADAAITTKLLKVVNSAYFGLPRQIVNVNQTIAILGMHQVRNLVMSIGVLNALSSPSPRILEIQKAFWQNSFAAASSAEFIGKQRGLSKKDTELTFIGGLLHDIGRLFLFTLFNLPYQEVLKESLAKTEPISHVEQRILGITHAELGGVLADKWNFPPVLADIIRGHDPLPQGPTSDTVMCVHIADSLADELSTNEAMGVSAGLDPRAIEWSQFGENQWNELRQRTADQVNNAKDLLGML